MPNLTNLSNVKTWGNIENSANDPLLTRLIANCSQMIMSYLERQTLFKNTAHTVVNGNGQTFMFLPQWPVIRVNSVVIDTLTIPEATSPDVAGWMLEGWSGFGPGQPQKINLNGYLFNSSAFYVGAPYAPEPYNDGFTRSASPYRAQQNVDITYVTGYFVENEAGTIPASAPYQIVAQQTKGTFGQDDGVTITSSGAAMTPVSGIPASGQYSVSPDGIYTFSAADQGVAVKLNYSYIPPDIEQACVELVIERYSYRGRVGQKSHSVGGQTTASYMVDALTPTIKMILNPYKKFFVT